MKNERFIIEVLFYTLEICTSCLNRHRKHLKFKLKKFLSTKPNHMREGMTEAKVEEIIEAVWKVFCRYIQMVEVLQRKCDIISVTGLSGQKSKVCKP